MRSWIITALVLMLTACSNAPEEVHVQGQTMGTTYNVKYVAHSDISPQALKQSFDARLVRVNELMSTYDPESELSKFNQWKTSEPYPLDAEIALVLQEALRLGQFTRGMLDITVGPLVNLWGFGPNAIPENIPSELTIGELKARIGLDKLSLSADSVSKSETDLYVDLSTIAKGYGVDQLAEILISNGITNFLVEIGGEMRVSGKKASGQDWRIAVEKPITHERAIQRIISVGDNAVATSGDYRNYYEMDGVRYSHLIDPRTGYPIQHNLVSVTVVHPSSMTADGLSTALIVMGLEEGVALAGENNIAALFVTKEQDSFVEYTTPAFDSIVTTLKH